MLGVCFLYLGLLHRKWNVQFRVLMRYAFPGSFFSLHSRDSDAQPCQIKWKQTKRKLWNVWVRSCPCCCQDIVRDFSLLTFRCQRKRQPQKKKTWRDFPETAKQTTLLALVCAFCTCRCRFCHSAPREGTAILDNRRSRDNIKEWGGCTFPFYIFPRPS